MQFETYYNGVLTNKISETMENEKAVKETLAMIADQAKARIDRCVEEADKYTKEMNEDYEHFFCWYSEDMYKVQLRLNTYRELQKVVNSASLCETLGRLNNAVKLFTNDLLFGSIQKHSTNTSFNTARLLEREVEQQIVCEFKMILAHVKDGGTEE